MEIESGFTSVTPFVTGGRKNEMDSLQLPAMLERSCTSEDRQDYNGSM